MLCATEPRVRGHVSTSPTTQIHDTEAVWCEFKNEHVGSSEGQSGCGSMDSRSLTLWQKAAFCKTPGLWGMGARAGANFHSSNTVLFSLGA